MKTFMERMKLRLTAALFLAMCSVLFPLMMIGAAIKLLCILHKKGPRLRDVREASYSLITGKD
jgi:hypothetical protein